MAVLDLSRSTPFAEGGNRLCFVHPDDAARCVKVMKPGRLKQLRDRAPWYKRWKAAASFDDNCREAEAFSQPALIDDSRHGWRHLARWYGWIETSLGPATVTELIRGADGHPAPTLENLIRQHRFDIHTEMALQALTGWLLQYQILTKNLLPHNLVQAADGTIKIIDGIGSASLLPLPASGRMATRHYIIKRISKMWLRINWERAGRPGRWRDVQHSRHLSIRSEPSHPPAPPFTALVSTQNFPPSLGGIQSYMHELCLALGRLGIPVAVLADTDQTGSTSFDAQQPFTISRHGGLKPLRRRLKAARLSQLIHENERSLVICDSWKSLEFLQRPAESSVIIICLAHGMEFPVRPSRDKATRITAALDKADVVLANSDYTRRRCEAYMTVPERLAVLLPGIARPEPPSRQALDLLMPQVRGDATLIVTVGRLEARKGQDLVIEALASLTHCDWQYVIIGKGPDEQRLRNLVKSRQLEKQVIFTGPVSQDLKHAWLSRADLFAMPSRAVDDSVEGFGIVYLEAAWFGVPSLAGTEGGASDAVLDEDTGLLVDGSSVEEIRQALGRLLTDQALRQRLGQRARQRVEAELLWPTVTQRMLQLAGLQAPPVVDHHGTGQNQTEG